MTNSGIARARVHAAGGTGIAWVLGATMFAGIAISAIAAAAQGIASGEAAAGGPKAEGQNMRLLSSHDLQTRSAYQPVIHPQGNRWILYIGHHGGVRMNPLTGAEEPNGTSILDVTNPRAPRFLIHIPGEKGTDVGGRERGGAQMVRVCDGRTLPKGNPDKVYMLRTFGDSANEVWDVTVPENPSRLAVIGGDYKSTHKNWWECDTGIAYLPATAPGWRASRVTRIFDLSDPANPVFVRDFGLSDQLAGTTGYQSAQIHGAMSTGPTGNRVYFGYGTNTRGVAQIVDREKLLAGPSAPTRENLLAPQIARIDLPETVGAHSTYPLLGVEVAEYDEDKVGHKRDFLVVVNESNVNECQEARQFVWFFDITDERRPVGVSTYTVREASGNFCTRGGRFGAHSTEENFTPLYYKRLMFLSWFNAGVRVLDVRVPYRPREIAYYIPATTAKTDRRCVDDVNKVNCKVQIQINNVEVDDRGLIYAVDRADTGLFILELTGEARGLSRITRPAGER